MAFQTCPLRSTRGTASVHILAPKELRLMRHPCPRALPHRLKEKPRIPVKKLTKCILLCETWVELRDLYKDNQPYLDHIHLGAIYNSLASTTNRRLLPARSTSPLEEFLLELVLHTISYLPRLDARQLANSTWAIARLREAGRFGDELEVTLFKSFVPLLCDRALSVMGEFKPQELCLLLYGLSRLGARPGTRWLTAFSEACLTRFGEFNAQDLALVLYSMAQASWQPSPSWLTSWASQVMVVMRHATPGGMAIISNAMAKLQYYTDQRLWALILQHLDYSHSQYQPQELVSFLWAQAQLPSQLSVSKSMQRVVKKVLSDTRSHPIAAFSGDELSTVMYALAKMSIHMPSGWLQGVMQVLDTRLEGLSHQSLVLLMWALGVMKVTLAPSRMELYLDHARSRLPQFGPQDLAMLVGGLGRLGSRPPSLWVVDYEAAVSGKFHLLNSKDLAGCLYGLSRLRYRRVSSWMPTFLAASQSCLFTAQPGDLTSIIFSLSRLKFRPSRDWTGSFHEASLRLLPQFTSVQLAILIWSLARIEMQPKQQWLEVFFAASMVFLPSFPHRQLAMMVYALHKLDCRPPQPWLTRVVATMQNNLSGFSQDDIARLSLALQHMKGGATSMGKPGLSRRSPVQEPPDPFIVNLYSIAALLALLPEGLQSRWPRRCDPDLLSSLPRPSSNLALA